MNFTIRVFKVYKGLNYKINIKCSTCNRSKSWSYNQKSFRALSLAEWNLRETTGVKFLSSNFWSSYCPNNLLAGATTFRRTTLCKMTPSGTALIARRSIMRYLIAPLRWVFNLSVYWVSSCKVSFCSMSLRQIICYQFSVGHAITYLT
jgi:hypothetical protein